MFYFFFSFFSPNKGESATRRPSVNSHNRLFGDVERVPPTPKGYQKSNIPIGSDDIDASKVTNGNGNGNGVANGNGTAALNGNGHANGNGHIHENGHAKVNGTNGHANGARGKYSTEFFDFIFLNFSKFGR